MKLEFVSIDCFAEYDTPSFSAEVCEKITTAPWSDYEPFGLPVVSGVAVPSEPVEAGSFVRCDVFMGGKHIATREFYVESSFDNGQCEVRSVVPSDMQVPERGM